MRMKIFLPVLFLLFFYTTAFAQTEKGNFVLSGKTDLNFLFSNTITRTDSVETGQIKSTQYGVTAGFGYFIADNLSLGVSGIFSYLYTRDKTGTYQSSTTESITSSFTILPQLTYYFPSEGKLRPFLGIGAGYLWMEERDSRVAGNDNKIYSFSGPAFTGGAGVSYFFNPSIAFDLGVQYSHNQLKDKIREGEVWKENNVAGSLGVSLFF